jgi:hypothetical protein
LKKEICHLKFRGRGKGGGEKEGMGRRGEERRGEGG